MTRFGLSLAIAASFGVTACVAVDTPFIVPPVNLVDSGGRTVGTVRPAQTSGGISLTISAAGFPHGLHAVHVHATGRCDPPSFESAGAHWNPDSNQHGLNNPEGAHAGDLPNVSASTTGVVADTLVLAGTSFAMLSDADGSSLIFHAGPDDYQTDPSGNSGARIGCAVLAPPTSR